MRPVCVTVKTVCFIKWLSTDYSFENGMQSHKHISNVNNLFCRHYAVLPVEMETHIHLLAASYIFIATFVYGTVTLHCLHAATFRPALT